MHAEAAPSGMERADAWSVRLLRVVVMMVALSRRSAAEAPPQFQIQPTGGIVPEGSTKILHCRASGDPQPDYRWIKDDVYLGDFSSNNFYKIVSASKQDVGDYSCIARNSVGSVLSNTGDVRVAYIQPIAAVQRALLSAKAGDALVIEPPPIDSYPESEVTWIGDGEFIFSFTRRKHIVTLQNALVILDVGATDAGVYSMEALNPQLGQAQYSGNVSVTVDGALRSRRADTREPTSASRTLTELDYPASATAHLTVHEVPRLGGPPLHQTKGEVGKQVLLSCEADGSPAPYVDWYRNTVNVSAIRTGRYTVLVNGSLVIDDLKVTDTGIFQCVASNVAGETTDYTWLRVERSAPVWVALPSNMTVLDGEDVTVVCKVDGAPTPTVTWKFNGGGTGSGKSSVCITSGEVCTGHQKHDGKDVSSSSHLQILSSGDLFVADVKQSDAGVYTCEAANELGSVTASAHLTVTVWYLPVHKSDSNQTPKVPLIVLVL
ncbi:PREDICTED: protein sidekick-1-like [Priapulus caudatus]|uniref:Protein sidekick-1-like n=1 Tax=Priapulus caudatus TaxID=37621 RepID=A0ABM1E233_PRICU|nr:PREDICTED: protein sidekick-1-like [Priapulus caudatus]